METTRDALYVDGFNAGYYLEQFAPELANTFASLETADEYILGIQDGRLEKVMEADMEKLAELDNLREQRAQDTEQDR